MVKGCRERKISKGDRARVSEVLPLGAEYSHFVLVGLEMGSRRVSFYARHVNRLSDATVRLNDGNALHVIEVVRASR